MTNIQQLQAANAAVVARYANCLLNTMPVESQNKLLEVWFFKELSVSDQAVT